MSSLLPPNATAAERAIDAAAERLADIPVPLRDLWNPQTIPAALLPWLAWGLSVDVWDPAWTEARKRATVAASIEVHRHKGTVGAMLTALGALDYDARLVEWWQSTPRGAPYTFGVEARLDARGIDPALWDEIERVATGAKNVRSHLTSIRLLAEEPATVRWAAAPVVAETVTVEPWRTTEIEAAGSVYLAAGLMQHETVTLQPIPMVN